MNGNEPIAWAVARKGDPRILVAYRTKEEAEKGIREYEKPYLEVRAVYDYGRKKR